MPATLTYQGESITCIMSMAQNSKETDEMGYMRAVDARAAFVTDDWSGAAISAGSRVSIAGILYRVETIGNTPDGVQTNLALKRL